MNGSWESTWRAAEERKDGVERIGRTMSTGLVLDNPTRKEEAHFPHPGIEGGKYVRFGEGGGKAPF